MKSNASLVYALFLIVGDFLALLAAFSAAYILRVKLDPRPLLEQIPALEYVRVFLYVLPLWILIHAFIGLYNPNVYEKRFSEVGRLLVGSFIGILVVIGYDFVSSDEIFPARLVPVYGLLLGFSFLFLFRSIARIIRRMLFRFGIGISNVLLVGDTKASEKFARAISDPKRSGQRVVGVVGGKIEGFHHFPSFSKAVAEISIPLHGIIQTELYKEQERSNEILRYAQENHVSYRFVPGNADLFVGNIDVELFAELPVIAVHQTPLVGWGRVVKRLFDVGATSIILIVALPVMAIIILLMKLLAPREKVFFRQTRLTRFNEKFLVFKFRSQYQKYDGTTPEEAFALLGKPELALEYRANGDQIANDPRITPVGKFLRATSLDELPQLFNVLKGDLSLVGPRALIPQELAAYEKRHAILSVKSGLTGLAQVSGRRDISFEERRKLDIYYVQNWTFWMDIMILLRTVRIVLGAKGAK
ncbi:MAG: Undecaprenyl-phosphate galactose phosphotransferase [Candidatus Saccharibacteria bacterium]|nr:Undecaprenyl-phosphate galactose phosphotransferase [Candidatus Saccharibacteria bacterium]